MALERGLAPLRLEGDPSKLQVGVETLKRELTELKVAEVGRQISSFRRTAIAEAAVASLAMASVVSGAGGASLLAVALAAFQGYKTYEDYKRTVRSNPAFFLWTLKN